MGATIGFVDWIIACAPACALMVPVLWIFIIKILKPEPITEDALVDIQKHAAELGPCPLTRKKTLAFLIGMPVLWILGSWIPQLNVTTVAIIGLAAMFLPGVKLLTFEEFQREVPWSIVIMIGAVLCLGSIVGATGGVAYLADLFLSTGVTELGAFFSLLVIMLAVYAFHTFVPIGPAFYRLARSSADGFLHFRRHLSCGSRHDARHSSFGNFLMPFNPGMALAYRDNCWQPSDLLKVGIVPAIIFVFVLCAWTPFASGLIGIAM